MKLFLQINIADWKAANYAKPLLSFASSLADDIISTDLDNQSDSLVGDLASKLIHQADKVFVVVIADNALLPLGGSLTVLNNLIQVKNKVHLAILSGEHALAEKMLKPFQENFKKQKNDEVIRKLIKHFAIIN